MAVNWKAIEEATKTVRAVGYCRVSTVDQIKGISLDYQADKITKWVEYMDYNLGEIYIEKGQSGAREDREQLTRLLEDAKQGKFDMVVVWKTDRFSRDLGIAVDVYRKLKDSGVTLYILDGNIDTSTPMGKMVFYQLSIFAEMEKDSIKERMLMGKANKVMEGNYIGKKPYGYDVEEGKLIVNEVEAQTIKTIFKLRAYDKMSLRAIVDKLNKQGIPSPSGKSEWNHKSLQKIISNDLYTGEYTQAIDSKQVKVSDYEAIVTKQMFGRANSK